eukprot:6183458-Prymnesium_polylepis.1
MKLGSFRSVSAPTLSSLRFLQFCLLIVERSNEPERTIFAWNPTSVDLYGVNAYRGSQRASLMLPRKRPGAAGQVDSKSPYEGQLSSLD